GKPGARDSAAAFASRAQMAERSFGNFAHRGTNGRRAAPRRVITGVEPDAAGDLFGNEAASGAGMERHRPQQSSERIAAPDLSGGFMRISPPHPEHLEPELHERS